MPREQQINRKKKIMYTKINHNNNNNNNNDNSHIILDYHKKVSLISIEVILTL